MAHSLPQYENVSFRGQLSTGKIKKLFSILFKSELPKWASGWHNPVVVFLINPVLQMQVGFGGSSRHFGLGLSAVRIHGGPDSS